MPRFEFRLQQYLGIKEQLEEQKELEYAKSLRAVEEEKKRLKDLMERKDQTIEHMRQSLTKMISPIDLRRSNNTIERLKQQISEQISILRQAEEFSEEKRIELLQAMKERKAIETVRDNQKEEYLIEVDKKERKQVDELVSFRYSEKQKTLV